MSKKKVITGWIGKNEPLTYKSESYTACPYLWAKDSADAWNEGQWPPRKVEITIKEL